MKLNYVKQIKSNEVDGKDYLIDWTDNKDKLCNIYGDDVPNFKSKITGSAGFNDRSQVDRAGLSFKSSVKYNPITTRFKGYSQFPRSITKPLDNAYGSKLESPKKEILEFSTCFLKNSKSKASFLDDSNKKLKETFDRYNSSLTLRSDHDKVKLIELIKKENRDFILQNKNSDPSKSSRLISLNGLKAQFLENDATKMIGGIQFKPPSSNVIKQHKEIVRSIAKKDKTEEIYINHYQESANKLFASIEAGIVGHNRLVSSNQSNTLLNSLMKDLNKSTFEVKETDSCISNETECGKKYMLSNITQVKSKASLEDCYEREKKLLEGFKRPQPKEEGIISVIKGVKLKTSNELYDEDVRLLKLTNPIAYQLEAKKTEYDLKELRKKKTQKEYFNKIMQK